MKCSNCGADLRSLGRSKCPHCLYVPPEIYIPFSWVAVWLWGDRSAANPCHGFLDPNTNECIRAFTAYPDEHWPNAGMVVPKPIAVTDTIDIRLEAENPRELCRMREKIRGVLTTV